MIFIIAKEASDTVEQKDTQQKITIIIIIIGINRIKALLKLSRCQFLTSDLG